MDALFLPVPPVAVPTIAAVDTDEGAAITAIIGGLTRPFSHLGVPAVSVPCGPDETGLPVGFQLVGRPFGVAALRRLAGQYQRATNWPRTAPWDAVR